MTSGSSANRKKKLEEKKINDIKKEDKKEIEADIYVINSDGGNLTNLETNKELVLPCNNLYSFDERMKSLKSSKWVIKKPEKHCREQDSW